MRSHGVMRLLEQECHGMVRRAANRARLHVEISSSATRELTVSIAEFAKRCFAVAQIRPHVVER